MDNRGEPSESKMRARDSDGRFSGVRFNVESVPRVPTFPARWVLEDPRGRAYFIFWTTEDGSLAYPLRMERIDGGQAVRVTTPDGGGRRIELVRRPSPNGTGTMLLYRCPICKRPRRYLYRRLAASMSGLVDCFGLQCQVCAGLRWASQGRYRSSLGRGLLTAVADAYGLTDYREPLPRHPWDPRAVSDPRMVINEFPDDLLEAGQGGCDRRSASGPAPGARRRY